MKSPLVDALRLASGQDKAANNDPAEPDTNLEDAPGAGDSIEQQSLVEQELEVPELSLMDATGVLVVQSNDEDDEFATSQVIAESAVNEEVVETSPAPAEIPTPAAVPVVAAVERNGNRLGIARLGMLSPLLCLLLASGATGAYFLVQSAGGQLQGTGLGMLTPQHGSGESAVANSESDQPLNRFPLVGAKSRPVSSRPTTPTSSAIAPSRTMAPDRVPMVTAVRSGVEDKAFAALNEAYAAYEAGDLSLAEAAYRQALEIAPRHPNGLHGLAAILYRTGRIDEALGYYETLLSVEPNNTEAAAALLAGRGGTNAFSAESEIKVLLQRYPGSAHLHYALGASMAEQGRWAEARLAYYKALAIEPENAEYQFNLAVSLENLGQYEDARARYEALLADVTDASAVDSQLVAARISLLAERSASTGNVP